MGPSTRDRDIEMLYVLRIGNLEESVRDTTMEETLYHIFKKFGRITVRVAGLGKSRHAFVNFESHDAAQDAHSRFELLRTCRWYFKPFYTIYSCIMCEEL